MTSCSNKVSEETTKAVTDFETAWGELGTNATNWANEVKACADKCAENCKKCDEMMAGMKDEKMKHACDSAHGGTCKKDMDGCNEMWGAWEKFKTDWDSNTTKFAAWKEKVTKGEVDDAAAKTELENWNKTKTDAETTVKGWSEKWTAMKTDCENHLKSCDDAMSAMMAPAKDAKGGKK